MSLNEPKPAETYEAISTYPDTSGQSHAVGENAEMILRLPDLEQIGVKSQPASSATATSPFDSQEDLQSPAWDSDSNFLTTRTSLPGKSRRGKLMASIGLLVFAGVVGVGLARFTANKFYDNVSEPENPAPNASEAPSWNAPQYASDKPASKAHASSLIPSDLTTPSLSLDIPGSNSVATKNPVNRVATELAPPTFSGDQSSDETAGTISPNTVSANPYGTSSSTFATAPSTMAPSMTAPVRPTTPVAPPREADRFSPAQIQAVLDAQRDKIQAVRYPQTQSVAPNTSAMRYPQTQANAVAQYPAYQQQTPIPGPLTAPPVSPYPSQRVPVSPYPPITQNRAHPNWAGQTWPGQQTTMTPSTPTLPQAPVYPVTGYPSAGYPATGYPANNQATYPTTNATVPNTAVQQPIYQQPVYR